MTDKTFAIILLSIYAIGVIAIYTLLFLKA